MLHLNIKSNYNNEIYAIYKDVSCLFSKFMDDADIVYPYFKDISFNILSLIKKRNVKYSDLSINGSFSLHSSNVAILSGLLGLAYNVPNLELLILGSLLHDIGKNFISKEILNKPGKLSLVERAAIDEHTRIGHKIISLYTNDSIVLDVIDNHHKAVKPSTNNTSLENLLTTNNLKIYPFACGISDIIDAMLSFRPYKKPLDIKDVQKDLKGRGILNVDGIMDVLF